MAATAAVACSGQLSQSLGLARSRSDASSAFMGTALPKPVLSRSCSQGVQRTGVKAQGEVNLRDPRKVPNSHKLTGKAASSAALQQLRMAGVANRYTSEKSSILVIGLSVHTAPVEIREKLAVPEAEWPRAIDELCSNPHIEEAGVLSTCNRMEIYVVALSWHRGIKEVTTWMSKNSGVPIEDLTPHLFILRNRDATSHLFRVASGLDSLVLGEGQILAQVKKVYEAGQPVTGFARNLNSLFKYAITAGKKVRTDISISSGAVSVSSAAVELAQMKLPLALGEAAVCIVGAGKMSKLLVKHLLSKGCQKMVLLNRSRERADELAADFPEAQIEYQPLTEMMRCAGEAQIVFTSTSSVDPLFLREDADALPPVSEAAGGKRLFIDISVPRNVGSCVNESAISRVFNVDDLTEVVAANKEDRRRKALEALPIIDEHLDMFDSWRDSLETVPVIKALRQKVEDVRMGELEKCVKAMGGEGMTKKQKKALEDMSRGICNKLLHGPMTSLRCDAGSDRTVEETLENMAALERMFELHRGPVIR